MADNVFEKDRKKAEKLSKDRVYGMFNVSETMKPTIELLVDNAQPYVREWIEENLIKKHGQSLFSHFDASKAANRTKLAAKTFGWLFTLAPSIMVQADTVKKSYDDFAEVNADFKPVVEANDAKSTKTLSVTNEVAFVERSRAKSLFYKEFKTNLSSLASTLPQLFIMMQDHKASEINKETKSGNITNLLNPEQKVAHEELEKVKRDSYATAIEEINAENDGRKNPWTGNQRDNLTKERSDLLKENAEKQIKEIEKTVTGDPDKQKAQKDNIEKFYVPAGTALKQLIYEKANEGYKEFAGKKTAMDKIKILRTALWDDPEASKIDGKNLKDYVRDIFEQHQIDMHQTPIAKRYDKQFNYALDEITIVIKDGKMDSLALVDLVGERKIVKDAGKSIAIRADVSTEIAHQIEILPAKFPIDPDQFLAEAPITIDDIKATIGNLKGEEKQFYITLLPKEVMLKAGVSEDEIKQANEDIKPRYTELLMKGLLDIASKSDEELKDKLHFSDDEIKIVRENAPLAQKGDTKSVLAAVGKLGKEGIDTIIAQDKDLWVAVSKGGKHIGDTYHAANDEIYSKPDDDDTPSKEDNEGEERDDFDTDLGASNDSNDKPNHKVKKARSHGKTKHNDQEVDFASGF